MEFQTRNEIVSVRNNSIKIKPYKIDKIKEFSFKISHIQEVWLYKGGFKVLITLCILGFLSFVSSFILFNDMGFFTSEAVIAYILFILGVGFISIGFLDFKYKNLTIVVVTYLGNKEIAYQEDLYIELLEYLDYY